MLKLTKQNSDYRDFLFSYCKFCQYETIVEIGVQYGYSAISLCNAIKDTDGKYFGYDYFAPIGAYDCNDLSKTNVESYLKSNGIDENKFQIRKIDTHSDEFKSVLKTDVNGSIDFAFIDGCHSYKGVTADFLNIYPLLSEEGSIAFHDTYSHTGCRKFALDLYTKYNDGTFDIVNLPYGDGPKTRLGLTILIKRSYPLYRSGITNTHDTDIIPETVYDDEQYWYEKVKRNGINNF